MKSNHIACAAIAATMATLGAVSLMLGAPDRLLGETYDRAFAASQPDTRPDLVASAHAPGSEHFWLTRATSETAAQVLPASTTAAAPPFADIKAAIAAAGAVDAAELEVIAVQELPRLALGAGSSLGHALLVTARQEANARQPSRVLRFILDTTADPKSPAARAL